MKRVITTILSVIVSIHLSGQSIPPKANTIVIKGVTFNEMCNALLDASYSIEKKDLELQTVRTEPKSFPKYWNAKYILNIRIKDSTAYITGTFTTADGGLWKDENIYNHTDKKGLTYPKSMYGYPFLLMNEFATSLNKEVSYLKN